MQKYGIFTEKFGFGFPEFNQRLLNLSLYNLHKSRFDLYKFKFFPNRQRQVL